MDHVLSELLDEKSKLHGGVQERALAEIIQSIALLGLSRSNFFDIAAFYGGTALRMLYGLDRFSEDLDFSLLTPNHAFSLSDYFTCIDAELKSFGIQAEITQKEKKIETATESAFIKTTTKTQLMTIGVPSVLLGKIPRNSLTKVKIEIDIDPPDGAETIVGFIDEPVPFAVRSYDLPSLFAGKMHALLARSWGNRIKGRDWYDMVFYVRKGVPLSLKHLEARLRQTGHYSESSSLSPGILLELLTARINTIDFDIARSDIARFVTRPQDLAVWSPAYFSALAARMTFTNGV
jgi:predicted nucleotidyltransferase component of viral defense system